MNTTFYHPKLVAAAIEMAKYARAPYSHYSVGAAVLTPDGKIIGGCNIENTTLSLTCCAERVALFSAVAQGYTTFSAIAIATKDGSFPCGACRQVIWELCGNIPVVISNFESKTSMLSMQELLPCAYNNHNTSSTK